MARFTTTRGKLFAGTVSFNDRSMRLKLIRTSGWIVLAVVYFLIGIIWYWGIANQWGVILGVLWWLVFRQLSRRSRIKPSA